jgi:hypothetical protein
MVALQGFRNYRQSRLNDEQLTQPDEAEPDSTTLYN